MSTPTQTERAARQTSAGRRQEHQHVRAADPAAAQQGRGGEGPPGGRGVPAQRVGADDARHQQSDAARRQDGAHRVQPLAPGGRGIGGYARRDERESRRDDGQVELRPNELPRLAQAVDRWAPLTAEDTYVDGLKALMEGLPAGR